MPVRSRVKTPGPLRRVEERERERLLVLLFFDDFRRVWLPDAPDRELLELRDRGGEDVRVAMRRIYAIATSVSRVTRHTPGPHIATVCDGFGDGW
jgi:hypothetical protein